MNQITELVDVKPGKSIEQPIRENMPSPPLPDVDSEHILSPETQEHLKEIHQHHKTAQQRTRKKENKQNTTDEKSVKKGFTYDDVPQWRKDNPIDDKQLKIAKESTLKNEITRYDIRRELQAFNRQKELHNLLALPENQEFRQGLEEIEMLDLRVQADAVKLLFKKLEESAKDKGVRLEYKTKSVGKITQTDINDYRDSHPVHAAWLKNKDREYLENFVALKRMKAVAKINNRFAREKVQKIAEQFPEEVHQVVEKYNKLNPMREPYRTVKTNKEILDLGKAKGIKV